MKAYFEGWYFKQQQGNNAIALIPSFHTTPEGEGAYLQVVTPQRAWKIAYPADAMDFDRKKLQVALGKNLFSLNKIRLKAENDEIKLNGELYFSKMEKPKYDIMGPFKVMPFMECKHSVFSLSHSVSGSITLNGESIEFKEGRGYIEGDRGYSFPKHYTWIQGFFKDGTLMISVAEVPFCGLRFNGVVGFVYYMGKEYRLATYLGARTVRDGRWLEVKQGRTVLKIELPENGGHRLSAPVSGKMLRSIRENLCARIRCVFKKGENEQFDLYCDAASFEDE